MRLWRSRTPADQPSDTSRDVNPQVLEDGLASQEATEAGVHNNGQDHDRSNWRSSYDDEKITDGTVSNDFGRVASTYTEEERDHVENLGGAGTSHDDHTHEGRRKSSVSRFLKWPHTTKTSDPSASETQNASGENQNPQDDNVISSQPPPEYTEEARNLVRTFTAGITHDTAKASASQPSDYRSAYAEGWSSNTGTLTPDRPEPRDTAEDGYGRNLDYVPLPEQYKPSIFGAILTSRLNEMQYDYNRQQSQNRNSAQPTDYLDLARRYGPHKHKHMKSASGEPSVPTSGTSTPALKPKWYEKPEHGSSVANLLAQAGMASTGIGAPNTAKALPHRNSPPLKPSGMIATAVDMIQNGTHARNKSTEKLHKRYDVVAEVADIIARRRYLTKLCAALMQYGAPTHRCEEYLAASARALLIDAQFMYIPGAMMCTFIDNTIQANSVELVRKPEGLDFGRLKDVFDVYKCVIHEKYTAEEGIAVIETIMKRPDPYSVWFRILTFGVASVFVGPFSFETRPIDFAPIFVLGCALGFMQLKVVPKSQHFSNVFEVSACVVAAFIARGLGSIKWSSGGYMFCFSGIAQSSIAMILPGFMVLNAALELQGRNIVSGSVRMVYAIIYVLFLGFGLLVGTTVFGLIKRDATDDVTCNVPDWFSPVNAEWKLIYTRFIWAPLFACCVAIIYRAKWKQLPIMALIAVCGHQANFWISTQLSSNLQVANAVGAFVIGCLANLYSRLFHGLAAAAMLPAIYCQVPGGLAASGSLVAGINSSNQIFGNSSSISVINNGTQGFVAAQDDPSAVYGGTIFNVGYGMVQVAIGISVGLYLSALVVYPYGKRNSGLFSF